MKKTLFMAAVLLLVAGITTIAQPNLQWIKNYGGLNTDKAYSVKQLPDNGYIVAGESKSNSGDVSGHHAYSDYWVARLDAAGNIIWQKSYGGNGNDIAVSVDLTNDGGFIIAGSSDSYDGDVTDHPNGEAYPSGTAGGSTYYPTYSIHTWVIKIDGAGNINWTKTLPFSLFRETLYDYYFTRYPINQPGKIIHTSDGGSLLTVKKEVVPGDPGYSGGGWISIPYLVKLNSDGSIAWANTFPDLKPEDFEIRSLLETTDGYVFVSSPFDFYISGSYDVTFVKVNFSGVIQSTRKYGGSGTDVAVSLSATTDGGYIIAGTTDSEDRDLTGITHHGGADYWVLKLNSALDIQWSKLYGGSQDDTPSTVIQLPDGNYAVSGTSKSDDQHVTGHTPSAADQPANSDIWLIKINSSNGDIQWSASYGGDNNETGSDLITTADGGLLVAGSSLSSFGSIVNKGDADWLLVKLNEGCSTTPPVSPANQQFCRSANPTVANLGATGQQIKWYDVPTGGSPLGLTTALRAAGTYYATQTINGCESARQEVSVQVFATPKKPAAWPQLFSCRSNPTISNLRATGTALKWYSSFNSATPLPSTTPLHTGIYYVTQTTAGICESKKQLVIVLIVGRCNYTSYNKMSTVTGETADLEDALVYPNPNRGTFKLFLNTKEKDSKVRIAVTDIFGKTVLQKDCRAVNGTLQEILSAANLPGGMYIVRYTIAGVTKGVKVIIEK